ncbi:ABC transporter substrate-binding protein [Halovivax cerinus]|uniref:ABC transporter substrate-binding protein n=1 Tax=Halovivax cerinus TaxID=1487865 RepID=A0ABD5NS69_9EURY|nr:ABC transporter substrate-binding protein [Halovivax cerinus]
MHSHTNRRSFISAAGTAGALALAGCLEGGNETGGDRTIKMGMVVAETGSLSSVGVPLRDVGHLPRIQINDADTSTSAEVSVQDSQTDPQQSISAAQSLANSGFPAVVGPLLSEATIQVTNEIYKPRQIVCCTPGSTSPRLTSLDDDDFVYRTISSDAFQGRALAQTASDRVGASSASVVYVNDAYGQALNETFSETFESNGGTIEAQVAVGQQEQSYVSQLEKAMSNDPDALFVVAFPAGGSQLLRDFYSNYSRDTPIVVPDSMRDPELPGNVGEPLTNITGVSSVAAGPGKDFVADLYSEEYDADTPPFYSYMYDASAILMLANAAAGANDGSEIKAQMQPVANPDGEVVSPENFAEGVQMAADGTTVQYRGASSNVDFDENGDMKRVNYAVFVYNEDGSVEDVDTIEYAAD